MRAAAADDDGRVSHETTSLPDIVVTRGEKALAAVLAVFLLIGGLWVYFEPLPRSYARLGRVGDRRAARRSTRARRRERASSRRRAEARPARAHLRAGARGLPHRPRRRHADATASRRAFERRPRAARRGARRSRGRPPPSAGVAPAAEQARREIGPPSAPRQRSRRTPRHAPSATPRCCGSPGCCHARRSRSGCSTRCAGGARTTSSPASRRHRGDAPGAGDGRSTTSATRSTSTRSGRW